MTAFLGPDKMNKRASHFFVMLIAVIVLCICAFHSVLFASEVSDTNDMMQCMTDGSIDEVPGILKVSHIRAVLQNETSNGSTDVYKDNEEAPCFLQVFSRTIITIDDVILVRMGLNSRTLDLVKVLMFGGFMDCIHNIDGMK